MPTIPVRTMTGAESGTVDLDDAWFGVEPNMAVLHQVVTAQLAARRAGSHSTKTRAEVAGGGAKPWRQKGTGRARQGSIRAPHWRGGGVAMGPRPRSYAQRTPKKMIRLALRSALSDRAAESKVVVIDAWSFDAPSTRTAREALAALGVSGRVLVVLENDHREAWLSFRNLPHVHLLDPGQLNAHDVLVNDWVVFTSRTLPAVSADQPTPTPQPQADAALLERPAHVSRENDMAQDLPHRSKPEPGTKRRKVRAEDRVKAVTDKDNPRFAAAQRRAKREEALRAQMGAKRSEKGGDESATATSSDAQDADGADGGFSFNDTSKKER